MYTCVSSTGGLDFVLIITLCFLPHTCLFSFFPTSSSSFSFFSTQIVKEREEESGENFMVEFSGNSFDWIAIYERRKKLATTKTLRCLG